VEADGNVELAASTRIAGLLAVSDRTDGPVRVGGVRTQDGREIRAELVVDALGRTSPAGSWLTALGARPVFERRSECGLLYYSRHFRLRDGDHDDGRDLAWQCWTSASGEADDGRAAGR
jgi:hypothetical protein